MSHTSRLLCCQWGAVGFLLVVLWLGGVPAWSAWIPLAAFGMGTATWVWQYAPDPSLQDREALKALAADAGVRGGLLVSAWLVWSLPPPSAGGPDGLVANLAVSVLLAGLVMLTLTMLTLIGLDAGRSRALHEGSGSR